MQRFISTILILSIIFTLFPIGYISVDAATKTVTETIPFDPDSSLDNRLTTMMTLKGNSPRNITINMTEGSFVNKGLNGNILTIITDGVQRSNGEYITVYANKSNKLATTTTPGYEIWLNCAKSYWYDEPPYSDIKAGPDGAMPSGHYRESTSKGSKAPDTFNDSNGKSYSLSQLKDINAVKAYPDLSTIKTDSSLTIFAGPTFNGDGDKTGSNPGTWSVTGKRELTEEGPVPADTYGEPNGIAPPGTCGTGRNYYYPMSIDWSAKFYKYYRAGTVTYTYDEAPPPPGDVSIIDAALEVTSPIKTGDPVELFDLSTSNPHPITRKEWSIKGPNGYDQFWVEDGSGIVIYGAKVQTIDTAGDYNVSLTVQNSRGERDGATAPLRVDEGLSGGSTGELITVDFYTNSPVYEDELVTYKPYTFHDQGEAVYLSWEGRKSSFADPGIYDVTLTGYDGSGNMSKPVTKQVTVLEKVPAVDLQPGAQFALPNATGEAFPYFTYNVEKGLEAAEELKVSSFYSGYKNNGNGIYHTQSAYGMMNDRLGHPILRRSNPEYNVLFEAGPIGFQFYNYPYLPPSIPTFYKYVDGQITNISPTNYPTHYGTLNIRDIMWDDRINLWVMLFNAAKYVKDDYWCNPNKQRCTYTEYLYIGVLTWDGTSIINSYVVDDYVERSTYRDTFLAAGLHKQEGKVYVEYIIDHNNYCTDCTDTAIWNIYEFDESLQYKFRYVESKRYELGQYSSASYFNHRPMERVMYYTNDTFANGTKYNLWHPSSRGSIRYGGDWKYYNVLYILKDGKIEDYTPYTDFTKPITFYGSSYYIVNAATNGKYNLFAGFRSGELWYRSYNSTTKTYNEDWKPHVIQQVHELKLHDGFGVTDVKLPGLPTDKNMMVTSLNWIEPTANMKGHFLISLTSYRWKKVGTNEEGADIVSFYDYQTHLYQYSPPDYLGQFKPAYFTTQTDYLLSIGVHVPHNQFVLLDDVKGTKENPLQVKVTITPPCNGCYGERTSTRTLSFDQAQLATDLRGQDYLHVSIPFRGIQEGLWKVKLEVDTSQRVKEQDVMKVSLEGNNVDEVTFQLKNLRPPEISLNQTLFKVGEKGTQFTRIYQPSDELDGWEIFAIGRNGHKYVTSQGLWWDSPPPPARGEWSGTYMNAYGGQTDLPEQSYNLYLQIKTKGYTLTSAPFAFTVASNRPPTAGFTAEPNPQYRYTPIQVRSTASDPDPGDSLTYQYWITPPQGAEFQHTIAKDWTKAFQTLGRFRIRQLVTDSKGARAEAIQFVDIINRSPVAHFTWQPQEPWEGDTVQFTNASSDPDGDTLTYTWSIIDPSGRATTASTEHVKHLMKTPGVYRVKLVASDAFNGRHETESIVNVQALTVRGAIDHTEDWFKRHQALGHEVYQPPKAFYSGEKMLLTAHTAAAPVREVTATLDAIGSDGQRLLLHIPLTLSSGSASSTANTSYVGVIDDPRLADVRTRLPNGIYRVMFRVLYENEVIKEVDVPFEIIGSIYEVPKIHRIH